MALSGSDPSRVISVIECCCIQPDPVESDAVCLQLLRQIHSIYRSSTRVFSPSLSLSLLVSLPISLSLSVSCDSIILFFALSSSSDHVVMILSLPSLSLVGCSLSVSYGLPCEMHRSLVFTLDVSPSRESSP